MGTQVAKHAYPRLTSGIYGRFSAFQLLSCLPDPGIPNFLRRPVSDGFLSEAEFAEPGAEAVHLRAFRVILGKEAFLEEQELMFRSGGVVDDGDDEALEVDLDAGEQLGERGFFKVPVVVEGELAGMQVDLDEVALAWIAIESGGTFDIDAEDVHVR